MLRRGGEVFDVFFTDRQPHELREHQPVFGLNLVCAHVVNSDTVFP